MLQFWLPLRHPREAGYLHDAMFDDEAAREFLSLIGNARELTMQRGTAIGVPSASFAELRGEELLEPRRGSAEQSNTSILFGSRLILKVFRRQQPGPNPDMEIGRYLAEHSGFRAIAPFAGALEYRPHTPAAEESTSSTLALLQGLVPNEGDGWEWTLEELQRYFELVSVVTLPENHYPRANVSLTGLSEHPESDWTREYVGTYLDAAALLGRRTAEMHLALGQPTKDGAFAPETMTGRGPVAPAQGPFGACQRRFRRIAAEPFAPAGRPGRDERTGAEPPPARGGAAGTCWRVEVRGATHPRAWGLPSRTGASLARRLRHSGFRRRAGAIAGGAQGQAVADEGRCRYVAVIQLCCILRADARANA